MFNPVVKMHIHHMNRKTFYQYLKFFYLQFINWHCYIHKINISKLPISNVKWFAARLLEFNAIKLMLLAVIIIMIMIHFTINDATCQNQALLA